MPPGGPQGDGGLVGPESDEARTMAMLCHLLVIFTYFVGPLIIWLTKKDESRFVDQQGKEALNWSVTLLIASAAIMVLAFVPFIGWIIGWLVSCLAGPAVVACNIVFGILSTMAVNKGQAYRYPVCIRFVK